MIKNKAEQYLENQIMTATKEELLIMLFDGAIRFSEQAKVKIDEKDVEGSCKLLIKSQRIVVELMSSLNKGILSAELYNNLMGIYNFIYLRLIDANMKKEKGKIDEALKILRIMRDAWSDAVEKNRKETTTPIAAINTAAQEVKSISVEG
ncbi:MAG: flagellar export chaperone FliS [Planctomycetes bacterium RBG_16_43_13]|nr:MAG: flagellar export chaperone FliS [Planctomycetes bacterium RBG_16_43_13]